VSALGAKVLLASDAIRRVVLGQTSFEERQGLARALLDAPGTSLQREERADLGLEYVRTPAVLEDGMWAAEQATKRGEQRTVERRLRACLQVASQVADHYNGKRIALPCGCFARARRRFVSSGVPGFTVPWSGASSIRTAPRAGSRCWGPSRPLRET